MWTRTVSLAAALLCIALAAPRPSGAEDQGETLSEGLDKAAKAAPGESLETPPAPAGKKKPARKKKIQPVSEYKFKSEPTTPTYKFDKRADPILKKSKSKGAGTGKGTTQKPKLQPVKSFGAQNSEQQQQGGAPDLGGIKLPPGINIPGLGGK